MLAEILHKIGFDWRVALSHTINIGIIFFILVKFALPKLKSVIDKRTSDIKQGLANKEKSEQILAEANVHASDISKSAQAAKAEVLAKAKADGEAIALKLENEAQVVLENAKLDFQKAKSEGYMEGSSLLERKAADILKIISQKAFADKVTPELESAFIKKVFTDNYQK